MLLGAADLYQKFINGMFISSTSLIVSQIDFFA